MIDLIDVDPVRVSDSLKRKITHRGCGKTVAKMIKIFSYLSYRNDNNRYLFVCENTNRVEYIHSQLYDWCIQSGFYTAYSSDFYSGVVPRKFIVGIPPKVPETVMEKFHEFRNSQKIAQIQIAIVAPEYIFERGSRYNSIILDLSTEQAYRHAVNIARSFKYGIQNG